MHSFSWQNPTPTIFWVTQLHKNVCSIVCMFIYSTLMLFRIVLIVLWHHVCLWSSCRADAIILRFLFIFVFVMFEALLNVICFQGPSRSGQTRSSKRENLCGTRISNSPWWHMPRILRYNTLSLKDSLSLSTCKDNAPLPHAEQFLSCTSLNSFFGASYLCTKIDIYQRNLSCKYLGVVAVISE
jgi:hypothetical protein